MVRKKATRTKRSKSPHSKPAEKREVSVERSGTIPEIFDSNKYDAMSELKGSAKIHGRDIRKTVPHLQRQKRLDPESTTLKTEQGYPAINPTVDGRAETLEKQVSEEDKNLRSYHRS